jgi:hypothetical protein
MTLKPHSIVWIFVLLFAASIRAQEPGTIPKDAWAEFASDDKRFKLLMPGKPDLQSKPLPGVAGVMKFRAVDLKSSVFLIAVAELSAKELARVSAEDRLRRASKGTASLPGRILVSEKKIDIDNYPGVEVFVKDKVGQFVTRIYLVDDRLYVLTAGAKDFAPDSPDVVKFFASFKLKHAVRAAATSFDGLLGYWSDGQTIYVYCNGPVSLITVPIALNLSAADARALDVRKGPPAERKIGKEAGQ